MYHIAICDDESGPRSALRGYTDRFAAETGKPFRCTGFSSANELLRDYPKNLDLLFMDIRMGGIDGMTAARQIRAFDSQVCLIFITTEHQYALEGYSVRAFGFLKKPVTYTQFRHELTSALHHIDFLRARDDCILLKSGGQAQRLPVFSILYCEVRNHSVEVHFQSESRSYHCQMKELEELLSPYGFFRCHASYLVNSAHIARIEADSLLLDSGNRVPVSQHRRKAFLSALSRYMGDCL